MSKQKWEIKTHEETPNWGMGDYDEYYEIINERGDAIQTTDNFDNLHVIADALNSFDGELRITTALEINQHCDNQILKMENEHLRAENSKMRKAVVLIGQSCSDYLLVNPNNACAKDILDTATEALKINTHG